MTNTRLNFIFLILLISSVQLTYAQQNTGINTIQSKGFKASVVKIDITPNKYKLLFGIKL